MSIRYQYASGRQQLCAINTSTGIVPGVGTGMTAAKAGTTYYFWIQGRNDIGYNLFSSSSSATAAVGERIQLTIPADCFRAGENWRLFTISVNTVDDPATSTVLLCFDAVDTTATNPTPITLPYSVNLISDDHISTVVERGSVGTFPLTDLVNGMIVNYSPTGLLYRYAQGSTKTIDNLYTFAATGGRWIHYKDGTNTFITDTTDTFLGCDVDVSNPEVDLSSVLNLDYALDGSEGYSRKLWINNDTNTIVEQGTLVGLALTIGGVDVSSYYTGLLKVIFEGYVNTTTGELDTTSVNGITDLPLLDAEIEYSEGKTDFSIFKPLNPGFAYQLRVFPEFNIYELRQRPPEGAQLSIYPYLFRFASKPSELAVFIGDYISDGNAGRRRIYPSVPFQVFANGGSGFVNGRSFTNVGFSTVGLIQQEQVNQKIIVNSDGAVYREEPTATLEPNEALRALVSTEIGESIASPTAASFTANSTDFTATVTVTHPDKIRGSYPDVIAGSSVAQFTSSGVNIYISKAGETRVFTFPAPSFGSISDDYNLTWSSGTVVDASAIPTTEFGFWTPNPVTVADISDTTSAETYSAYASYTFNGTIVTNISHSTANGCIPEWSFNLSELGEIGTYWGKAVADLTELNALDTADLPDGHFRFALSNGNLYRYDKINDQWVVYAGGGGGGGGSVSLTLGSGEPASIPNAPGEIYYDEIANLASIGKDITSSDDWLDLSFNPDRILTDNNGNVLTDNNGNVLFV